LDFKILGSHVTLAHWRLGILDPRPGSDQPFQRKEGGPVIVFNGEIYNYLELRRRIGGDFRTTGDTEVLLAAYEKWGAGCLEHLRGMFAFVVFDPGNRRIFLARDRFGIKPLYFRKDSAGAWEFGSEIKQVLGSSPRANTNLVRDFLLFGAQDHTAGTLFAGVEQLRGGEYLEIDLAKPGTATPRQWYSIPAEGKYAGEFEQAVRRFRNCFFDMIGMHLRSDVPLGFCLSGGMDSSAIVCTAGALLRETGNKRIAINCRYEADGLDEHAYARAAAALSGSDLDVISPDATGLSEDLARVTWHQDEPVNNASVFSQYRVFAEARRRGLKVMLDGQGGDELLASYPQFFGPYLLGLLTQGRLPSFFEEVAHFRNDHGWGFMDTLRSLALWFTPRPVFAAAKRLGNRTSVQSWARKDFLLGNGTPVPPWQSPGRLETRATTRSMSILMLRQLTLPMLLHWEDRNSMAHSIESRVPFLDHELVELALSLPDDFKIRKGVTKRVLKSALRDLVPPTIAARRDKMGFATPDEIWMRQNPGNFFGDLITAAADENPAIFDGPGLTQIWKKFEAGGPYTKILWRACAFAIWARTFHVKV